MKEHAKKALKHDFQVAGKTIPTLAVAALLLVGTGSAALLSSFGTVDGTADVSQAVYFDSGDRVTTELDASYDGSVVAGTTTTTEFTLKNNASVPATVELVSDAEGITGISQTVVRGTYQEQSFDLYEETDESYSEEASSYDVNVVPSMETVTYKVELPSDFSSGNSDNVDVQIAPEDSDTGENYHVKYNAQSGASFTWGFYKPSWDGDSTVEGSAEEVEQREEVVNVDYEDNSDEPDIVTVEVRTGDEEAQSFGVNVNRGGGDGYSTESWTRGSGPGDRYLNEGTASHEEVDIPEVVTDSQGTTQQITLQPGTETFLLTTDFNVALNPTPVVGDGTGELDPAYADEESGNEADGYNVDLEVQTVTE